MNTCNFHPDCGIAASICVCALYIRLYLAMKWKEWLREEITFDAFVTLLERGIRKAIWQIQASRWVKESNLWHTGRKQVFSPLRQSGSSSTSQFATKSCLFLQRDYWRSSLLGGEMTINTLTLHFRKLLHSRFQQKFPTELNWSIPTLRSTL